MSRPDWRKPQTVETVPMLDVAETAPPRSDIPRACGLVGPYTTSRPGKYKTVHLSVKCTRPDGHDGNHQHAGRAGPTHEWTPGCDRVLPK